jgi:hypothetical protein
MVSTLSSSAEASSSRLPPSRSTPTKPSIKGKERASTDDATDSTAILERKKRKLRVKYPDATPKEIDEKTARWWERQQKARQERRDRASALGLPEDELDSADDQDGQVYQPWQSSTIAERLENAQSPVWTQDGR